MGMQDKLLRAYIKGCNDTWDLVDAAIKEVPGIGPKTHAKLLQAVQEQANKEVAAVESLRPAERKKLDNMIDGVGFDKQKTMGHIEK